MAKIEVIVGTTLGGAEYVSDELISILTEQGHETEQHLTPDLGALNTSNLWLLVSSTHGAGELPDNIQPFHRQILEQKPDLTAVKFAACSIGDSSYDTFCEGPELLIKSFQQLGAKEIVNKIQIDVQQEELPEDTAINWLESWKDQIL
ncbi:FMN-binding protein MioC [Shewanella sp. 202IG2-18]|uniref:FMN-binding protein MioC n=1 Tax=Parashewanella hymeniacidonis TaxID=2807618 RepID=UPI00195F44F7|nr:FMN-binding protein MioC [Parashewanella hymeniacidonis]MBM7073454.1 FMN-binding protein MioC [Parashewanella hymeniacidonis]